MRKSPLRTYVWALDIRISVSLADRPHSGGKVGLSIEHTHSFPGLVSITSPSLSVQGLGAPIGMVGPAGLPSFLPDPLSLLAVDPPISRLNKASMIPAEES